MSYLEEINNQGRWLGMDIVAIHQIGDFAFVETVGRRGQPIFSVLVNDRSIGQGANRLDQAILMALAYKYKKEDRHDIDAWRYAARVLRMEEG